MVDLTTTYLGLTLKNPIVASAAQPISEFQNHNVVLGVALSAHALICGSYQLGKPKWSVVSPSNPRTP